MDKLHVLLVHDHDHYHNFRKRYENKNQDWYYLLAKLHELSEWTEKREKEFEAMAPLGGDEATLQNQQASD